MNVLRFDFNALQDFRDPPKPILAEAIMQAEIVELVPPPPPTYSEQELNAAKDAEYQRGHQMGIIEGRVQAENEQAQKVEYLGTLLAQLAAKVNALTEQHLAFVHHHKETIHQLVLLIGRKVAGDAISKLPEAAITQMVEGCLGILFYQPKVVLTVHPDLIHTLQQQMPPMLAQSGVEAKFELVSDPVLQLSEGRIEWQDGMAERRLDTIWHEIETRLAALDLGWTPPTPDNMNNNNQQNEI